MGDGGHLRARGGIGAMNGRQEALRMQAVTCTAQQVGQAGQQQLGGWWHLARPGLAGVRVGP